MPETFSAADFAEEAPEQPTTEQPQTFSAADFGGEPEQPEARVRYPKEPSDEEVAEMFGQKPKGKIRGFFEGFEHPFASTGRGPRLLLFSDDHLKEILHEAHREQTGGLLKPVPGYETAKTAGTIAGSITQGVLTGFAASRGGVRGIQAALAATFGSAGAYDAFIKAGTRALEEGKGPDEALKIGKISAAAAFPISAGLGAYAPGGKGFVGALKRGGILGGLGGTATLVANLVEKAQGLQTPAMEGVPESALTMGLLPPGLHIGGKVMGLVPNAVAALTTKAPRKSPTSKPSPTRMAELEMQYYLDDQPVELIEISEKTGKALVRTASGEQLSVRGSQLTQVPVRKGVANAIPEQEATEPVPGVQTQSLFGEGEVPTRQRGQRVRGRRERAAPSERETEASGSEVSLALQARILQVGQDLEAAKQRGAPAETQMRYEVELGDLMEQAQRTMYVDDLVDTESKLNRMQRAGQRTRGGPPPLTPRPKPPTAEELAGDAAERKAIDDAVEEINQVDTPPGEPKVNVEPPNPDDPFSSRGIAWTDANNEIVINKAAWREWLDEIPFSQRPRAIKALLSEEAIHRMGRHLFSNEQFAGLWRGLTGVERALLNKFYTGSWRGVTPEGRSFADHNLGHEYFRLVTQWMLRQEPTEIAEANGLRWISKSALDMVQRFILFARRVAGKAGDIHKMLDVLERRRAELLEARIRGEAPPKSLPAKSEGQGPFGLRRGGRRRPPPEDQEGLNLLPPIPGQSAATGAEMGLGPTTPPPEITPAIISEAIEKTLAADRPDFRTMFQTLKTQYPRLETGHVAEQLPDKVWETLGAKSGKELEKLRDRLNLRYESTAGKIPDRAAEAQPRGTEVDAAMARASRMEEKATDLENKATARRQNLGEMTPMQRMDAEVEATGFRAEARKLRRDAAELAHAARTGTLPHTPEKPGERPTTPPGQQARADVIAAIGQKLLNEGLGAQGETPSMRRAAINPSEIGWGREREGAEPAWRQIGQEWLGHVKALGKILTSGSAARTTSRAAGGKRLPDSVTHRVTAFIDRTTGAVELLGTYAHPRKGAMVVDPSAPASAARPHISLEELLARRVGGQQRYRPIYSIMLDTPVSQFRQRYAGQNQFKEQFADAADLEQSRRLESAEEAPALQKEGAAPEHPGMRMAGDRLTAPEAETLFREISDLESAQGVLARLKTKSEAGTLTPRDWMVINALRKEHLRTLRNNPNLKDTDESVTQTIQKVVDEAQASRGAQEFANRLGVAPGPVPGGGAQGEPAPGAGARELALAEGQPQAAEATRAYHTRIGQHGEFPQETGPRPEPPAGGVTAGEVAQRAQVQNRQNLDQWLYQRRKLSPSAYTGTDVPGAPEGPLAFRRPRPVRFTADVLRYYAEWMMPRLLRMSQGSNTQGFFTRLYAPQIYRAIDREKQLYGDLSRWLDPAKRVAGAVWDPNGPLRGRLREVRENFRAVRWANQLIPVTNRTAYSNFNRAVEGRIQPPTFAQRAVALWQQANFHIGEMLEPVVPGFQANGSIQRNLTAFGYDIIRQGRGDVWRDWIRGMARATGTNEADIRTFFLRWKEALDNAAEDPARAERVLQDFNRNFANVVTHVRIDDWLGGHWEPVVHSNPYNYLESAARRATHIRAFREEFPVNPATGRNATWQRAYEAMRRELPGNIKDLDALSRAINGHPTDSYADFAKGVLAPDTAFGSTFRKLNQTVGNLWAKSVLTGQIPTQLPETLAGATPQFLGAENYLRAMTQVRQLWSQMELDGQVNRLIYDMSYDPNSPIRSAARILGNVVAKGTGQNFLNELQEGLAAATARIVRERIDAGAMTPWEFNRTQQTFRAMQFTGEQARLMMRPSADPAVQAQRAELLNRFERTAANWLTSGNKSIAEGSRLGGNRLFNSLFRFQSYPMMKMNQLRRVFGQWYETLRDQGATDGERAAAARLIGRFFVGNGLQGAGAVLATSLFYNWIFGTEIAAHEAADEPVKFMVESSISSLGGPLYLVWRGARMQGLRGVGEQATRTIFPFSIANALIDMFGGYGAYKDENLDDRLATFVEQRIPGTRMIRTGLSIMGLGQKNEKLQVALRGFYRWRASELGWTKEETNRRIDLAGEFRVQMKRATLALQKGDREAYREALTAASAAHQAEKLAGGKVKGIANRRIARSFQARKVLEDLDGRKLSPAEMQSLEDRIGAEAVRRLRHYDMMLDAAADGIMLQPLE